MKKQSGLILLLVSLVCSMLMSAAQAGENRYVRVINKTGTTVERVYVSHSSMGGWGTDRLGSSKVLPDGYNIRVYPADNTQLCIYDLRAVLVDGRDTERREVNICGGADWTLVSY